ncbi:MAG: hypothetical protein J5770_01260 [Bacteroidaceae bacterium]|nr:hypothetical protein [Bacteroidaceae bacterium]
MKKTKFTLCFLTLSLWALAFSVVQAQNWDRPRPTDYQFASVKPSIEAKAPYWEGDTTVYYLYNVEGDGFLSNGVCSGHAPWGTHATIKRDAGNKVMLAQYRQDPLLKIDTTYVDGEISKVDTTATITPWDGVTYKLMNYQSNTWWCVFPTSSYNMFVDKHGEVDYMWNLKSVGDNKYRLSVSDLNPTFNSHMADSLFGNRETYMGFNRYDNDYDPTMEENATMPLTPMISVTNRVYWPDALIDEGDTYLQEADPCVDWMFMPEAEYLKFRSHVQAWDYLASGELDILIEDVADQYGNKVDLSKLRAFVSSTSPVNYEDIVAARNEVQTAVRKIELEILVGDASIDNPADLTSVFVNPDFEEGNANGWTLNYVRNTNVTNLGYQSASYSNGEVSINKFIEAWSNSVYNPNYSFNALGDGSVHQTIVGMPEGMYELSCDAIAACQSGNEAKGAFLYMKNGEEIFELPIATANNRPQHFTLVFKTKAGNFEMGFKSEDASINWIGADNFKLLYYGQVSDDVDPAEIMLQKTIALYENTYPDLDDLMANIAVRDAFKDALDAAKSATTDFEKADSTLNAAADALAASINDYKRMWSLMEELHTKADSFEDTKFAELGGLLQDYYQEELENAYMDCLADAAMIDTISTHMTKIIVEYVTENVEPGDDITPLIVNGDFNNDFSGWQTEGSRPQFGGKGGNGANSVGEVPTLTSGNAEVYHATFNMYQIIKNMPKGSYKLTCQAFERNDGGYLDHWAQNPTVGNETGINAVLYANSVETKIHNVMAFAQEEPVYEYYSADDSRNWASDVDRTTAENGGWIPNSMDGANFYFSISPETYRVSVYFTVENDGDSIVIGLKNSYNNSWVIFDNFRLYFGSGYNDALEDMIVKLNTVASDDVIMAKDAQAKIDAAKEAVNEALNGGNDDECIEALKLGNDALVYAKASVAAYTELLDVYSALTDAYYEMIDDLSEEKNAEITALLAEVEDVLNKLEKSVDDVKALTSKMRDIKDGLYLPEGTYIDLLPSDFYLWTAPDETGEIVEQAVAALNLNTSTGIVYGSSNGGVYYLNYVDLSKAKALVITATAGTPRCLFNRVVDEGTVQVEVPRDADYWTIIENPDGSKTYIVDTRRIMQEYGFVHLHSIKGANWQNTTVTSIKIGLGEEDLPEPYVVPEAFYVDLQTSEFYEWTAGDQTGEKVDQTECVSVLNEAAGIVYGDNEVRYIHYADLGKAKYMVIRVNSGTPRVLFNRAEDHGTIQVELPRDAADGFWTNGRDNDGTTVYVIDLAKIFEQYGYVHLHAIKGQGGNVNVASVQIGYENAPETIYFVEDSKHAVSGIYTVNGVRTDTFRRGLNIVVGKDGTVSKMLVR